MRHVQGHQRLAATARPVRNRAACAQAPVPAPAATGGNGGRLPFKDFCAQAFATGTADKAALLVIEQLCAWRLHQLDESVPLLKNFENLHGFIDDRREMTSLAMLAYAPKLQRIALPYGTPIADFARSRT